MSAIEQELIAKISQLDEEKQRRVLEFVRHLEESTSHKTILPSELYKLPPEERDRLVHDMLLSSADEDFEIFDAYSEEDFDDAAE